MTTDVFPDHTARHEQHPHAAPGGTDLPPSRSPAAPGSRLGPDEPFPQDPAAPGITEPDTRDAV